MSHVIIIIDEKLDCVASNYPAVATSADALKATADGASAALEHGETEGMSGWHETLEAIQTTVSDWCDNGTNLSTAQMCEVLDDYRTALGG